MIYPIVKLNQNNLSSVSLIDTEFNDIIIEIKNEDRDNILYSFYVLLQACINQFHYGYEQGYNEGYYDAQFEELND